MSRIDRIRPPAVQDATAGGWLSSFSFQRKEPYHMVAKLKLAGGGGAADETKSLIDSALDGELDATADAGLTPGKPATLAGEILDPITGELIALDDIDSLVDAYERIKRRSDELYAGTTQIRAALAQLVAGGTGKTRRVQGRRRKAVVEMPGDSWDQSKLKEVWNAYPQLRDQALKIDTVGVKLREWKKLTETAGTPDVETFIKMLKAANEGPQGMPSIKIEE